MPDPDPAACSLDMRMAVCRKVPLFADLDDGQLAQVNRHCQAQNFAAGEPVYLEGDAATHIYVVAIGAVKTTRLTLCSLRRSDRSFRRNHRACLKLNRCKTEQVSKSIALGEVRHVGWNRMRNRVREGVDVLCPSAPQQVVPIGTEIHHISM